MSQNSNNSEWMALCYRGGARTCPALSHLVRKGSVHSQNRSVPFTELECSNSMILLLWDNHTQLQRPLAEKRETEQSYNKPWKKGTKKKRKKQKNKIKIRNTQCQITNPLRYNNISKWEEFKNNSCSLSGHGQSYGSFFFFFFLKRLKRGNPAPLMPWGPLHKEEVHLWGVSRVAMETGEPPPRGVATGTNQERGDKTDARWSNLAKRRGVRSLTGPRLKKVPRLNLNTTQRAGPPRLWKQLVPPELLTFV